ncbi:9290_t:CDS:2 [Entrophospora sp. SA101]|nr:9290_t:CDS:2 [Entrophospora sp. SA101]
MWNNNYPPKLAELDLKSREKTEPTDLASLEEEREIAKQQLENMKQVFFNFAMSFLLIGAFSLHPFAFDRSNSLFGGKAEIIHEKAPPGSQLALHA